MLGTTQHLFWQSTSELHICAETCALCAVASSSVGCLMIVVCTLEKVCGNLGTPGAKYLLRGGGGRVTSWLQAESRQAVFALHTAAQNSQVEGGKLVNASSQDAAPSLSYTGSVGQLHA